MPVQGSDDCFRTSARELTRRHQVSLSRREICSKVDFPPSLLASMPVSIGNHFIDQHGVFAHAAQDRIGWMMVAGRG